MNGKNGQVDAERGLEVWGLQTWRSDSKTICGTTWMLVYICLMVLVATFRTCAARLITDYKIVTNAIGKANNEKTMLFSLQSTVKREIGKGWQPLGPVSVGTRNVDTKPPHDGGLAFYQTMVKYEGSDEL